MSLALHVSVSPDRWPVDAACDVAIELVLRNDGPREVTVFPAAAKIAQVASFAGIGITWSIGLGGADGAALPVQELRRYYGPPGNPPSPAYAKQRAVALAAGQAHASRLGACWIPHRLLEPRHLAPDALDPERMDNIAAPSRIAGHPALAERFPLAGASVLVFGATWAQLEPARAQDDFLRGYVVAFAAAPGPHELRIAYVQDAWMGIGTKLRAEAAPVRVQVGS